MLSKIENEEVETYLQNLSATDTSDYSLWKATKSMYRQTLFSTAIKTKEESWAKSELERANEFANHLGERFKPFPREVAKNDKRFIPRKHGMQSVKWACAIKTLLIT